MLHLKLKRRLLVDLIFFLNFVLHLFSYMYWSESGPRIGRATLAGTEKRILFDCGYQPLLPFPGPYPQQGGGIIPLVIDFNSNLLYGACENIYGTKYMYINLDGSDTDTLTMCTNEYYFSVALHKDVLYESQVSSSSIETVNLNTGQHENMGWLGFGSTYGIALNDSSREPQGTL